MTNTHHIVPLILLCISAINVFSETYRFDFGSGETAENFTKVLPNQSYSESAGFGFESNSESVQTVIRNSGDALFQDYITGEKEIFFSVKVPQGNYDLTVYLGDPEGEAITTIMAENQRLLLDRIATRSGQSAEAKVTVNNRETTSLDGSVTMSIKDRERDTYYTWDNKLTLRFSGSSPAVSGIVLETNDTARTLFLCGNSTVVDQVSPGWASWGQMIPRFLAPGVVVANYAESGLTAPGFLSMRRLDKIMADAKPGDYVFVEFGHNDQKNSSDANNYPNNLETFYNQITAKGANPIFVTPTARDGDRDTLTSIAGLAQKMREKEEDMGVPLIDLNSMSMQVARALGSAASNSMYNDVSHFKPYGAYVLANCVANALLNMETNFHSHILAAAEFDPSQPHPVDYLTNDEYVTVPTSPQYSLVPTKNLQGLFSKGQILYRDGKKVFSANGKITGQNNIGNKSIE